MNYVGENIKHLRRQRALTQADLAAKLGVNRSLIGAYEEGRSEPRLKTLQALCLLFKVDLSDLVNNDLSSAGNSGRKKTDIRGNKLRILSIAIDAQNEEQISLVPKKAAAGYTRGFSDVEYIEQLPAAQLPFPELRGEGTHRIFQIEGDSMLPVLPGSYIIAEYVSNWEDIKSYNCYVVITRNEGIVYKRIINDLKEKEELVLHSDNPEYKPYPIEASEVLEVWKARGILNFELPAKDAYLENDQKKMLSLLQELKDEIKSLKN